MRLRGKSAPHLVFSLYFLKFMADSPLTPEHDTEMNATITFTAGCGGSGKTYMVKKLFPGMDIVDPDAIKMALPGYDPLHPEKVHEKSSQLAMRAFYSKLGQGHDFIFDGTGRNVEKYITLITAAKAAGFKVRMVWVRASLETCLRRNAERTRKVPADVILEAHQSVEVAQKILAAYVDEHTTVDND